MGQMTKHSENDPTNLEDPTGLYSWNPFSSGSCEAKAVKGVKHVVSSVGNYVEQHPLQTAGLVLGAASLATGVGAVAAGFELIDLGASGLAVTSVASGLIGAAADGPGCYHHEVAACVGPDLNSAGALLGGLPLIGGGTIAASLFGGAAFIAGGAGLSFDLAMLLGNPAEKAALLDAYCAPLSDSASRATLASAVARRLGIK